ncbi:MAG: hypothetical protein KGR22_11425, partial [Planctomycetes bacterium]|nr:hypothetical protein [Planctomycetota bacterium]
CDVLRTEGVPEAICASLAAMSCYDEALSSGREAVAVRTLRHGGETWGVITRTVPCGPDYTGRANRLAHHLVVAPSELAGIDPAAVLGSFAFRDRFEGEPRYLRHMPDLSMTESARGAWRSAGLAGWDAMISKWARGRGARDLVVLPSDAPMKSLVSELLACLAARERWTVGVCSGCDAQTAWNEGCQIRLIATKPHAAPLQFAAWPGERLHDLRGRPVASMPETEVEQSPAAASGDASRRWVSLEPELVDDGHGGRPEPIEVKIGGMPDAIEIGAFGSVPELGAVRQGPDTSRPTWGIVCAWFAAGVAFGTLLAIILSSTVRQG